MEYTTENILKVIKSMRKSVHASVARCKERDKDAERTLMQHLMGACVTFEQVVLLFEDEQFFHEIARLHKLEKEGEVSDGE